MPLNAKLIPLSSVLPDKERNNAIALAGKFVNSIFPVVSSVKLSTKIDINNNPVKNISMLILCACTICKRSQYAIQQHVFLILPSIKLPLPLYPLYQFSLSLIPP